jgi:hypothetical protein
MNQREIETPTADLIEEAIDAGDTDRAKALLRSMVGDWERNKDYSINWITSLLSFIGRRMGEPAVEEALRDFGDRYLKDRREGLGELPKRKVMEGLVRAMKANGADVDLTERDDQWEVSFRCGSGGKLIDEGAYGPPRDYLTLRQTGPVTFGRDALPVYCAHCSVNNEMQPIEWTGAPLTVQEPPTQPGERCVHHVFKNGVATPGEWYRRVGKEPPRFEG